MCDDSYREGGISYSSRDHTDEYGDIYLVGDDHINILKTRAVRLGFRKCPPEIIRHKCRVRCYDRVGGTNSGLFGSVRILRGAINHRGASTSEIRASDASE